jgi:hypothetical protein
MCTSGNKGDICEIQYKIWLQNLTEKYYLGEWSRDGEQQQEDGANATLRVTEHVVNRAEMS